MGADSSGSEPGAAATPARPTLPQALLVLAAVVIGIGGYVALSTALGVREAYIGFVFVFYWLSLEHGNPRRLPAILAGASFGLACAWLLQFALHSPQVALLMALFMATVGFSIVCLVMGWLPWVMNTSAMLILTVFTIPYIQQGADFPRLFLALAFAAGYFGVFVLALTRLAARRRPTQA